MEKLLKISDENIWEFIIDYFPLSIITMVIGTALIVSICGLLLDLLFELALTLSGVEKGYPILDIYFMENDHVVTKSVFVSEKISINDETIKNLTQNFIHIWKRVNEKLPEVTHYSDEMIKAKKKVYLKRNETLRQFYEQLHNWGIKTKEAKRDKKQLKKLMEQLEVSQYTIYKVFDEINDELVTVEAEYKEKEKIYRTNTLNDKDNIFKNKVELNS